ncbi:hypothetical protein [Zavarzinella formosa]|uniref:hypothetical protein n=1 Tax=Zavarzinella formosa TaxID=360055 RepID=UPI0003822DE7|nr:hypothetical protein [Zavarzinella formosa]
MTRDDILAVMLKITCLTDIGVVSPEYFNTPKYGDTMAERLAAFDKARHRLVEEPLGRYDDICDWLAIKERTKTVNRKTPVYALRFLAERFVGTQVTDGELIVAAVHLGFVFRLEGDGVREPMTFYAGISNKSLRD